MLVTVGHQPGDRSLHVSGPGEAAGGLRDAAAGAMLRCYAVASVVTLVTSSAKPAAVPRAPGDPDCNYHHHQQPGVVEGETWSSFVSHSADTQPAAYFRQPGEMTLIPWS